ncbi:MAG: hypothetical protein WC517_03195 [Patescibacteria group bacterium]
MKCFKNSHYRLSLFAFMLALLAAMSAFVIYPALSKITAIKKEITSEKADLEKKLDLGLNAQKIKEDLKSIEAELAILDSFFIPAGGELELLGRIEALAAKNSVTVILKPDFNGANLGLGLTKNSLDLAAQGSFKNLMSFLNGLDSADFLLVSDQISLAKTGQDNLSLNISSQFYLQTAGKTVK